MERLSVSLGVLTALLAASSALLARRRARDDLALGGSLVVVGLLTALAAAIPPFGRAGQGLLAGGLLAALALRLGALTGPALGAAGGLGALALPGDEALGWAVGITLGAWLVATLSVLPRLAAGDAAHVLGAATVAAAVSLGALATALGEARGATEPYGPLAVALVLVTGAAQLAALPARGAAAGLAPVLAIGLAAAAVALLGAPWRWLAPYALGVLAAQALAGLRPGRADAALRDGLVAALLVAATGAVAFALGRGYGLGLAALALARVAVDDEGEGAALAYGQAALSAWCLLRVASERYGGAARPDLFQQTILLGLVVGLLAPLAGGLLAGQGRRWSALAATLVGMALGPVLLALLWGPAAVAACLAAGPVAALWLLAVAPVTEGLRGELGRWVTGLPLLAGLSAALCGVVLPNALLLRQQSRWAKTGDLVAAVAVVVLLVWWQARTAATPTGEAA